MTDASTPVPVPEEVGQLYDRSLKMALTEGTFGTNLHFGYWPEDPDEESTLADAAVRLTDVLIDRLGPAGTEHVLDIGCGVGGPALRIAERTGARVTGISNSQEQITQANRITKEAGRSDRVDFQYANALELPFPDASFDSAIALESIIHMPDREQVFREVSRILRPGGRVVLTDFFAREPIPVAKQRAVGRFLRDFMMTLAQADDYVDLLRRGGLRFEEISDISARTMRRTFQALATPVDRGEQEELFGHDAPDLFDPADMVDVHEFGCLLVVARRP